MAEREEGRLSFHFVWLFPLDIEQSLFPLRDSPGKLTSKRAQNCLRRWNVRACWPAGVVNRKHYTSGSTRASRFNSAGDFTLALLFGFFRNLSEKETARKLFFLLHSRLPRPTGCVVEARLRSAPRVLELFFPRALLSRVLREKTTALQSIFTA